MRQSILIQNDQDEVIRAEIVRQNFILLAHSRNCQYQTPQLSFTLDYCKQYHLGSWLTLIGRVDPPSDKRFFNQKRLTIHSVEQLEPGKGSVKAWLEVGLSSLLTFRERCLEVAQKYLPEPEAGLVSGMVFGGTDWLPDQLEENLRTAGLTHVVSASGFNVSMVVGMGLLLIKRLPRLVRWVLSLLLVVSYALMAGLVPPVVRAAVMIALSVTGTQLFFRRYHPGYSLVVTTLGLISYEPWYARNLSFWLSIAATAGIVWILPHVERLSEWISERLPSPDWLWSSPRRLPEQLRPSERLPSSGWFSALVSGDMHYFLGEDLGAQLGPHAHSQLGPLAGSHIRPHARSRLGPRDCSHLGPHARSHLWPQACSHIWSRLSSELTDAGRTTIAAQVFTLPITWFTFGQVSLVGFISNPVLLWLTPLITVTGLWVMILGVITTSVPALHTLVGLVGTPMVWLPTRLFLLGAQWFGQWRWGVLG